MNEQNRAEIPAEATGTRQLARALTIAGSDSGGGAGIQADLKTFGALGVFGMSALTAITAQNTVGVQGIFELPPDFVRLQITSVLSDIGADAVKTGMLSSVSIIESVAATLSEYGVRNLVVDPVMVAKGGDMLLRADARDALIQLILPLAEVVTPNLHEAGVLTGKTIETTAEMRGAAEMIHAMGARYVLVKGGHLPPVESSIDILFDGSDWLDYEAPRIETRNNHGTGCTLASAIAAGLAKGLPVRKAVEEAKQYLTAVLQASHDLSLGHGHGPMDHFALARESDGAGN